MEKYFAASDLPAESSALIEDQELIAVGSNASRDGVSVLVEYGYIYEPPFRNEEAREAMFKELAYQTYIGIKKFLAMPPPLLDNYETALLPYSWNNHLKKAPMRQKTFSLPNGFAQRRIVSAGGENF